MEKIINKDLLPVLVIFLIIFVMYLVTMLPSQGFHDVGELQTKVATVDIAHPTGFPTYILLGKIIISILPIGEIAWRVNLLSVIYSLLTLILLFYFLKKLTKENYWILFGPLYLAFSLPFWNWSGQADTHTLSRMFLALLILLFYNLTTHWSQKSLFLFGLTLGLGLGNHLFLLYSVPGFLVWYILFLIKGKIKNSINDFNVVLFSVLLGISVYLFLPIREYLGSALSFDYSVRTWEGFYRHVSGADFQGLMYRGGATIVLKNAVAGLGKIAEYFYLPGLLIGLVGIWYGLVRYRVELISLVVMLISFLMFSTNYPTSDATRYYLSFLTIYSIFISLGAYAIYQAVLFLIRKLNLLKISIVVLSLVFLMIFSTLVKLFGDNFKKVDKSLNYSARNYSQSIFNNVGQNGVILSWWNYSSPLWYRRYVLKERADILVLNKGQNEWKKYVDEYINNRPVYVVEKDKYLENYYKIIPFGDIYQVIK